MQMRKTLKGFISHGMRLMGDCIIAQTCFLGIVLVMAAIAAWCAEYSVRIGSGTR